MWRCRRACKDRVWVIVLIVQIAAKSGLDAEHTASMHRAQSAMEPSKQGGTYSVSAEEPSAFSTRPRPLLDTVGMMCSHAMCWLQEERRFGPADR